MKKWWVPRRGRVVRAAGAPGSSANPWSFSNNSSSEWVVAVGKVANPVLNTLLLLLLNGQQSWTKWHWANGCRVWFRRPWPWVSTPTRWVAILSTTTSVPSPATETSPTRRPAPGISSTTISGALHCSIRLVINHIGRSPFSLSSKPIIHSALLLKNIYGFPLLWKGPIFWVFTLSLFSCGWSLTASHIGDGHSSLEMDSFTIV